MKTTGKTGRSSQGRRTALGLLLACSALVVPVLAASQTLFPTDSSPLPSLSDSQIGTAGTSTITRNAQGLPNSTSFTGARPAGTALDLTADPNADPTTQNAPNDLRPATPLPGAAGNTGAEAAEEDLNQPLSEPLDAAGEPIDQQEAPRQPGDPTGIRLGSFMLRPSVSQSINTEITRSNGAKDTRNYLATGIRGTLSSDWSRHALTVTGEGVFEHDLSGGNRQFSPEGTIAADLRLDLADDTIAHVTGGYNFTREDTDDPNAVGDAETQSGVHQFNGGLSVERDLGRIHGLAAVEGTRSIYTDAKLSSGDVISMADRDRTGIDGRLRLGYELSTAIIPFIEVASGHTFYDQKRDNSGYARSSQSYAARTGVEFDFGDKLRGEVGTGYEVVDYEDSRLDSVGAVTFDGKAVWSPRRGTDVNLGLRTTVQDSTTAGQSGWIEYQLTSAVAHEIRDNLTGRLTGSTTFRNFDGGTSEDNMTWVAGAGLTWAINRYFDFTSDIEYERTTGGSEQDILRAGVGLSVKR
ncbi:hypothetical protein EPK99_10905 [Neorhizobium lilium]|uniref:Outer membrane beta-barrel protein n=1 Tax=Neorhizobium lilium TaxID=2503024 RepID=A0A3S3U0H0_9HYPH|nr:outer membrane beta-barrel protein [Neorhizobium lilium]RWX79068.1 hypothetical protein EPK99_10905 [Neorhizobium lilium]